MLAKSSTELVRQQNSALVLSALRRHGRLAHTEISDATGLASATVSAITADLERARIIEKSEQQAVSGRGRPRVLFSQRRGCGYLVTIIISSDSIQYSLVDYAGTLLDRFTEPRGEGGTATFLAAISAALTRAATRSRIDPARVLLVSISSKGLAHPAAPVLVWSPVFGAQPVDFSQALTDGWSAKVILNNETLLVAGALLEREAKRKGEGEPVLAALSLGHSIGLGIARRGGAGLPEISAPNFGHMLHMPDGGLCRCGARGCIEAYAGFYAILRTAFEVPMDTIPAKFVPIAEIDKIAAGARQGNRMAQLAFRHAGVALGNGLSRLLSLHGHMPVFITGPGTRHYDLLQAGMEEGLSQTQVVRLGGMPNLLVVPDEASLVFEGHLNLAFSIIDQDIIASRPHMQAAGE
ncbi:Sugar kinase of the NBD/HSP70 family, may contain an N-terminal HTH domain [Xaviernesmea oryzae]|uniref:Sugar kinase of the NBD/HSP70 family, may contain an N-terminal HTH domain n=1 Tax=Xaviernesmea oryzae TaxID=464029 RepID=A0A1X7GWA5_9HYPH|nr:ROK family transcriptional regulator [Xaviernesmea oryzae]SMF75715.1 Sugar kinase of the NBD/HSP70 family, may contain an N-terminal HTH domain [Xaviernesmea oryzae]